MPYYERQPYIQPLYSVVSDVMRGEIRIPRFQRPGTEETWTAEQRGDLLDSLYRGFPIGTILLWSTATAIKTMEKVGGFGIPPPANANEQGSRLLLDGHQRLSTLVRILGPGLRREQYRSEAAPSEQSPDEDCKEEQWVFELDGSNNDAKTRERFILLREGQKATQSQLPLKIVLDRADLNKWIRDRSPSLTDEQISAADALRDRLREYSIPVAVLVADSLQDATESFKRINSSGEPMSDFNMVAALAYRNDFDPQEIFADCRSRYLEPIGWQEVSDGDILRVCAAGVDQAPLKFSVDHTARKLSENRTVIETSFQQIAHAAEKLGRLCSILSPKALPYSWQLITLATCLCEKSDLSAAHDAAIRDWFWLTTYGEVFGGVNSAVYARSWNALRQMMSGTGWRETPMERDVTAKVREPQRFDFRAARSKACALAMARFQDKKAEELAVSAPKDLATKALATKGASAMGMLQTNGKRSCWWHLMVIADEGESLAQCREALKRCSDGQEAGGDSDLLKTLGIPAGGRRDLTALLADRREFLKHAEKEFVSALGLQWADS